MLRHVYSLAVLAVLTTGLSGCGAWNAGRGIMDNTFRKPTTKDIDNAGGDTIPSELGSGWGGSDFSGARGNSAPEDTGDFLGSPTARDIERRLGVE